MAVVYYWYETYLEKETDYSNLQNQKNSLLQQSLRDFNKRKQLVVKSGNLSAKEAGDLIGCLIGDKEYLAALKQLFEANYDSYGIEEGSWKKRAAEIVSIEQADKIIANNSNQIQEAINVFQEDLTRALDQIYQAMGNSNTLFQLMADKIKDEIHSTDSTARQAFIEQMFRDYMAKVKDGLHTTISSDDSMEKILLRCATIAEGIRVLGASGTLSSITTGRGTKAKTVENVKIPDCFEIIGGKLDGLMRNIKGLGAEMALAQAFKDGEDDILKVLQKVQQDWIPKTTGKGDFTVTGTVSGDDFVHTTKGNKNITVRSKADVSVEISANGIAIHFGVSVKQYDLKGSPKAHTSVSLSNNTTFDRALRYAAARSGLSYDSLLTHIYNTGGAHLSVGKKITTEGDLEKKLDEVKEFVVWGSLLEMLAGTALNTTKGNSDNVMFFSLNGKIFPVNEIFGRILNKAGIKVDPSSWGSIRGINRANMKKHNAYVPEGTEKTPRSREKMTHPNEEKAIERSKNAASNYRRLMNAKLNINMSILNKLVM